MTTFRFNFITSSADEEVQDEGKTVVQSQSTQLLSKDAIEVTCDKTPDIDSHNIEKMTFCHGSKTIQYINVKHVEAYLTSNQQCASSDVISAIENNTDLIPSVYEGGLKIWECSIDLIEFLQEQLINFDKKNVIELGCGAGLPGIFALTKGADKVDFQDYNEEVIRYVTIPNVFLNCATKMSGQGGKTNCHFYAGDWSKIHNVLQDGGDNRYDVVLTSETIYSPESQEKLYKLIKRLLKANGVAYVAAKTIYFGVGGGTRAFEALVNEDNYFQCEISKQVTRGVNREILRLHRCI